MAVNIMATIKGPGTEALVKRLQAMTTALHMTKRNDETGWCAVCGEHVWEFYVRDEAGEAIDTYLDDMRAMPIIGKHKAGCVVAIALGEPMAEAQS